MDTSDKHKKKRKKKENKQKVKNRKIERKRRLRARVFKTFAMATFDRNVKKILKIVVLKILFQKIN